MSILKLLAIVVGVQNFFMNHVILGTSQNPVDVPHPTKAMPISVLWNILETKRIVNYLKTY
jgi:hypothetical protein